MRLDTSGVGRVRMLSDQRMALSDDPSDVECPDSIACTVSLGRTRTARRI
jgi:hypothetical protein